MKHLRKTIRRILLENQSRYDKLVDMIFSEKIGQIEYALQLAEAAEYIGEYTYKEETHYASRSHTWMFHEWDEAFFSLLSDRVKEKNRGRSGGPGLRVKSWESGLGPNGFSASIRLVQYPPFE